MHEMAVTDNILQIILAEARKEGAARVTRITLVIGELSSIMDESVQLYFDMLCEGTLAEKAELVFHRVYATLRCQACAHIFSKQAHGFICPQCGGAGMLTGDAKEFYIESMEIECNKF